MPHRLDTATAGRIAMCLAALFTAVALVGCGGDDSGGDSSSSESTSTSSASTSGKREVINFAAKASGTKPLSYFQDNMEVLFRGTSTEPEVAPNPPTGKKIALIEYGLASSYAVAFSKAFVEAAEKLDWDVKVSDGKFTPSVQADAIRSAIAERVDAIVVNIVDCPTIQSPLLQAKQANIPVLGSESLDCSQVKAGAPTLFASLGGKYNLTPFSEPDTFASFTYTYGREQATAVITATGGKAKVISMRETDAYATTIQDDGFRYEISQCADCEVVDTVEFTAGDLGAALQQKVAQALARHPEVNAIGGVYDAVVTGGLAAAVRASKRKIYVAGGEGNAPNLALVRSGVGQNWGNRFFGEWEAYAGVDILGRIFNGEKFPEPRTGHGQQPFDRERNLPPTGAPESKVDFRSAYLRGWGVEQ